MVLKNNKENKSLQLSAWFLAICIFLQSILPGMAFAGNNEVVQQPAWAAAISKVFDFPQENLAEDPAVSLAIPGGPDQPEVQSFTPIGLSDMVNPFTGDFSYNIPLVDVDGYPINLAYSAGVGMDEEASWVGLGWNLNPGVVNRVMRGLPDEFNGSDRIEKEMNVKNDWTVGIRAGVDMELFGFEAGNIKKLTEALNADPNVEAENTVSIGASLGLNFNSYNGYFTEFSISPSLSVGKPNKPGMNFGLGLSGSSSGGASVSPSVSARKDQHNSISIGTPFNTRQGLQGISFGMTHTRNRTKNDNKQIAHDVKRGVKNNSFYSFGGSTFSPQIAMPMNHGGITFSFKAGADFWGLDGTYEISGHFSNSWLKDKKLSLPAYGYFNLSSGQDNDKAMMDFSRENDGPFTKNTPCLPIASLNFDIFNVSGQGANGSYRAYRNDIGFVFDPQVSNGGTSGSLGLEVGLGGLGKYGIDISATYTNSNSGAWRSLNQVKSNLKYTEISSQFREANEMSVSSDPAHFAKIGGDKAVRFENNTFTTLRNNLIDANGDEISGSNSYARTGVAKRNQLFHYITRKEQAQGQGIELPHPDLFLGDFALNIQILDHHIGEATLLNTDGTRYVYGIAAYNKMQKDVSFSVYQSKPDDCAAGLVSYDVSDASASNSNGIDHSFNSVKTPAYAHSFLLTSVLNSDYSDLDNIKGPSKGDLGGYIKFSYQKIDNYKWKTPMTKEGIFASFDEGLNSDGLDNKAHYSYGEKELWYVNKVETKNHVLVFYTSDRWDGHGVTGEHGVVSEEEPSMQKLDKIELYSLPDYERDPGSAVPLKTVHFEYDYSLCKNYIQNVNPDEEQSGKLTLKRVFFTYQGSKKGRFNSYKFEYGSGAENPDYDLRSTDRWGNYKENEDACDFVQLASGLRTTEFPYVGFDKEQADENVKAWNLKQIHLPSGGRIEVFYESDDYAYVQHKKAKQMFKIVGIQTTTSGDIASSGSVSVSNESANVKNAKLYFEMMPGYTNINDYATVGDQVYFRALMNFKNVVGSTTDGPDEDTDPDDVTGYDFVPGYAEVKSMGKLDGQDVGWIELEPATLKDAGPADYNPIAVAAIQFGRMHLSRILPPSNQGNSGSVANIEGLAKSLVGAFTSYGELFTGPNGALYNKGIGTDMQIGKSWLRLNNPNEAKLGGGHRVKEIRIHDAWDDMTSEAMDEYYYGQVYSYTLSDGVTSSGVAAYEPALGQDENVWKVPVKNDKKLFLAPDIRNYQEEPFGESYFPSAAVGYSRVTVKDLPRTDVHRHATGKIVHEFYTAKDFPTLVSRTGIDPKRLRIPLMAYFFTLSIDEMSASQGFVVEKNDMHGKPKAQYVYAESQNEPISSVEYHYQHETKVVDGIAIKHLTNTALTINKKGEVSTSTIGLDYDAVADFRKSTSHTVSGSVELNLNAIFPVPAPIPGIWGSGSLERTAFHGASFTKIIERFGILSNTVARDLGSQVETNNLAYDSETGQVLLTQTTTDFNDKVYSFNYPAHWYYDDMGQAYLNTDYIVKATTTLDFASGINTALNSINTKFKDGDELILKLSNGSRKKAWVLEVNESHLKLADKHGNLIGDNVLELKVYRSARKNMQGTSIGSLITRNNPLNSLIGNTFKEVLQAGSVEFSEEWRTFCECLDSPAEPGYTTNPYVKGLKGNWRPKASYTYLSDRTQTFENANSNIRVDGTFSSFSPFYKFKNGSLSIDRQNWTSPSTVTEFSPFGQALETQDALNRYSSSSFGYNQTFANAVATNTRYMQLGFDGFEDYDFNNCSDNHFKLAAADQIEENESHTGKRSVKATSEDPVVYTSELDENCEPEACNLDYSLVLNSGTTATLTVINGEGPYTFEYDILFGGPRVNFATTGDGLIIVDDIWTVKVYITDANGCTLIREVIRN